MKRLARSKALREILGSLIASYLKLVYHTNRFIVEPSSPYDQIGPMMPVIVAMWHGQHFMVHFAKRPGDRAAALVSKSGDGELNATVLRHLGISAIRGSGARGRKTREKGGSGALRGMMRALQSGDMVVMTADVPKVARLCGQGIVTLAKLSKRPIVPVAVVTSRRIDFTSWDKASLGLPFGRGAIVLGEPVFVDEQADAAAQETARLAVQDGLDRAHERAYTLIGSIDPGAKR